MPLIRINNWPGYDHIILVLARAPKDDAERVLCAQMHIGESLCKAAAKAEVPVFEYPVCDTKQIGTLTAENFIPEFGSTRLLPERKTVLIFVDGLYEHPYRTPAVLDELKSRLEQEARHHLPKGNDVMVLISQAPRP